MLFFRVAFCVLLCLVWFVVVLVVRLQASGYKFSRDLLAVRFFAFRAHNFELSKGPE